MERYLEISYVGKTFNTPRGPYTALRECALNVERGEFVSLIGHSGCGKSTLLSIVAGLTPPTIGGVILEGKEITDPGPDRGMVFQQHALLPWLSALDNVLLAVEEVFPDLSRKERRDRAMHFLEMVGLKKAADKHPAELSGGMCQRVGIARALAMRPKVLLLDEPFGALDALTRGHLQDEVIRIWQKFGQTVLMVTHDVDEAILLSDRIALMTNGPEATIARIERVNLARPRNRLSLTQDPGYASLRGRILSFLHELRSGQPV
ncbi:MAG TPA: ABC transporter ATP-binding protein [Nitrospiria bacterium]|nr:ABC transporter ATP-binding protein [Nitrospiria bacterium]